MQGRRDFANNKVLWSRSGQGWKAIKGNIMHKFVLGAVLCASLGLPANSAELLSGEKTASLDFHGAGFR